MAKEKDFEGASEKEALRAAAEALGTTPDNLDYTLVDEGAEGVFGLGARSAKVRVALPDGTSERGPASVDDETTDEETTDEVPAPRERAGPAPEKLEQAIEVTQELLKRIGVEAAVEGRDEEEHILVQVSDVEGSTEVRSLFEKARPPLAPSLQFVLNKIVNRFPEDRKHILIEAAGAAARQQGQVSRRGPDQEEEFDPELVAVAHRLAERAVQTGKVLTIHPMLSGERRAVHQTLMKVEGVKTVSSGEGLYRQMHVVPKGASTGRGRPSRSRRREDSSSDEQD